ITMEDGLAQNMVDCILQDSQGFMWFGTWNGLCRYDGYKIDIFNTESADSHALKSNFIYALREDRFGNVLIGTKEGLYVYLYDKNEFRFIDKLMDDFPPLTGTISLILPLEDNSFWIGTDKGVVHLRVLDSEGKMEKLHYYGFGSTPNSLSGTLVRAVAQTSSGLWVGTDEGVNVLDTQKQIFHQLSHSP